MLNDFYLYQHCIVPNLVIENFISRLETALIRLLESEGKHHEAGVIGKAGDNMLESNCDVGNCTYKGSRVHRN